MAESSATSDDRMALDLLIRGFMISRMLRLIADCGAADRVGAEGDLPIEVLAAECGTQPQSLIRVLRALASVGVFSVSADGRVAHTPRSRLLRTDTPRSMHHSARFWAATGSWAAWEKLDAAMTGGVPHEAAWNMTRFAYLRGHPEEARGFDAMMAHFPDNRHAAIAAAYDFSAARVVADLGGGNGAALRHILPLVPAARGVLFDRDDVVRAVGPADLLDGRITAVAGSFFDDIPPDADVYMLVRVLHDWPDEDCQRILRTCRAAMRPDAVLLVCDHILETDPAHASPNIYLLDMQMMAMFGSARERTRDEMAGLLSATGFTLRRAIPTESAVWIVEAVPS